MNTAETNELKLLLITDSSPDELIIRRRLERAFPAFELVRIDRPEQLEPALNRRWDGVVFDHTTPALDFEATVARLHRALPDTPIVLVADTIDESTASGLLHHGVRDYVPMHCLERLPRALHQAMDALGQQRRLASAEHAVGKFQKAVDLINAPVLITDTTPKIEYANSAFERVSGYPADELIGRNPSLLSAGLTPASAYEALWSSLSQGQIWHGELKNRARDGSAWTEEVTIAPVHRPDGTITHYVGAYGMTSAQRESERIVRRMAYHDHLTELPNRTLLVERLNKRYKDEQPQVGMVLVLDLDDFKFINDLYGFAVADQILIEMAERLSDELEPEEALVARVGGNRFAVLVDNLGKNEQDVVQRVRLLTERIRRRIDQPLAAIRAAGNDGDSRQSASIGVSLIGRDERAEDALSKAEMALAQAREQGRGRWRLFDPVLQQSMETRVQMELDLTGALKQNQFSLALQSVFTREGRLAGAEALMRWERAPGEFVSPAEFIPVAEASGLIEPIGNWVLRQAARRLRTWTGDPATRELRLGVNVSARQFFQPDFIRRLQTLQRRYEFEPSHLVIELTESAFLDNIALSRKRMDQCVELGFRLALDDFGTGYSSMSYLNHLPFHTLKIDRSFIADMLINSRNEEIVRATIALGHALDLTVIGEGIENREQWARLQALGCDFMQGFLMARPVPESDWQPGNFS